MLAVLLSRNTSVTCMLTCKQIGASIGCQDIVKTHHVISLGLLTNVLLVLRSLKQDCVPTVAFTDSFGGVEACGTYAYYLASAFKQVHVHPEGTWAVTGGLFVIALVLKLFKPVPLRPCKCSQERAMHNN